MLDVNGETMEVDSRPSDAIALAVRVEAPIYAEEGVLDRAGVVLDEEGHHLRQSYLSFLTIGEAGHGLALDEQLAIRGLDMVQRAGGVADHREGLAGGA